MLCDLHLPGLMLRCALRFLRRRRDSARALCATQQLPHAADLRALVLRRARVVYRAVFTPERSFYLFRHCRFHTSRFEGALQQSRLSLQRRAALRLSAFAFAAGW